MLEVIEICKEYNDKVAIDSVNLIFPDKGLVIIKGESGCGKTTLLNLLTAHDYPTSGVMEFNGVEINSKNSELYRKTYCSNIYQDYMLIEDMTVGENIELAMQAYGEEYTLDSIKALLNKVGIPDEYIKKQASKLSGGEKQRVSIARAIAKENAMIFADEPTGNLDSQNGEMIMDLLKEISKDRLVVVVSHHEGFNAKYADYTVELVDGVVESCNLPQKIDKEDNIEIKFENKSKLKFRSLVKLAFWGYKKNKAKSIASIFTFVILSILSIVFAALSFGNLNYAYAQSISKCEKKNVFADSAGISDMNPNPQRFMDKLSYGCAEVYHRSIHIYTDDDKEREEEIKFCKKYQIIEKEDVKIPDTNIILHGDRRYIPRIQRGIICNDKVGVDVDVLYGDYPKEFNEIMLPYCYALYMSQVLTDYKTDDVKDLIGKEIIQIKGLVYYSYKICGIFEEGPYFTDFDKPQSAEKVRYYYETNKMAQCVIYSPKVKEYWKNNPDLFMDYSKRLSMRINNEYPEVVLTIYDRLSDYSKQYAPLEKCEVYLDKYVAEHFDIKVGDRLNNVRMLGECHGDINGFVVKDIIDVPQKKDFIILTESDYNMLNGGEIKIESNSFYFNMKNVKNIYGFLNEIRDVGFDEDIWWGDESEGNIDYLYAENINITARFYVDLVYRYKYFVFLPITVLLLIGLAAMGFVSTSYLIASKGDSYNILCSLGFGKKNIALILTVQVFSLILLGCILGIIFGALNCHLFGKIFIKSRLGDVASLATEVLLPMGYIAPIIVVVLSLILGASIVAIKTKSLFSKSIIENKQAE